MVTNIAFAVQRLGRQAAGDAHWMAKRVLRYLKGTRDI